MDETYIKVKGKWVYLYRAVDSHGDTFDKAMVLFDNIIQIFNLAYVDHSGKPSQN
jgi:flavodoxin